jgi:hypothetical protein
VRSGYQRISALAGAVLLTGAIGVAFAAESGGDGNGVLVTAEDDLLVGRLLELESGVPKPLPSEVLVASSGADVRLVGSFTSARAQLDGIEDELRQLFVDAEVVRTDVGIAIADVTRGLLLEREALLVLEAAAGATDARPTDGSDARDTDGVAVDADGLVGLQITGMQLALDARSTQRDGYAVLAALADHGPAFEARLRELASYSADVEPDLITASGRSSTQMLVPIARYDAPLGVAVAVGVSYACVDRDAYEALATATPTEQLVGSIVANPDPACADVARRAGLDLTQQIAEDQTLTGVVTAVTNG